MEPEKVLLEAEFNPKVCNYWLANGAIIFIVTVVGIPLLPIWLIFGKILTHKHLRTMECTLTDRSLKVKKGLLTKVEKTVPLDKITDMGLVQGPIMRYFDVEAVSVETAGQSAMGSSIILVGMVGGREFRDAVLSQRDLVTASQSDSPAGTAAPAPAVSASSDELLRDIRDTLHRIEEKTKPNQS